MTTGLLEAFSDGVMAIIITIMVLELKVPEGANFENLKPLIPKLISYLLSFAYVGIYWNNHHHLFQAVKKVDGKILWANLLLLLFLSVIPFTTGWMGENQFEKNPTALYGLNLLFLCIRFYTFGKICDKTRREKFRHLQSPRKPKKGNAFGIFLCGENCGFVFYAAPQSGLLRFCGDSVADSRFPD